MDNIKAKVAHYLNYILKRARELREDRNALVFLFFLFLSTCFWILNALSKDNYTTELKYPIHFINDNDEQLIKGDLRRNLILKVRGGGFSILNYHLNEKFLTQDIDLTGLPRIKFNDTEGVIISTKEYMSKIEGKLSNGMYLVEISPDTLFVPLVDKVSKMVPVSLDAKIDFVKQCQLSGNIIIKPDSVLVSGPCNIVDTLSRVLTKPQKFIQLNDTIIRNVGLMHEKWLEYNHKRVVLTIPVEPFTEAFVEVPVMAEGLPDSLELKAFPSDVRVSYRLGLTKELYKSMDFVFTVDFSSIDLDNLPHRMKVKMKQAPENIGMMNYSPLFVEFLLEKSNKRNLQK